MPKLQPEISLTPAPGAEDEAAPVSSSNLFARALGLGFGGPPAVSSTCASVDSDSDYQGTPTGSAINTPSRPLSRSSTMSGMSMTATKDGVEGNKIHRFRDPLGYTKWMSSTTRDDSNTSVNGDLDSDERDSETPGPREDDSVLDVAADMAARARLDSEIYDEDFDHEEYYGGEGSHQESLRKNLREGLGRSDSSDLHGVDGAGTSSIGDLRCGDDTPRSYAGSTPPNDPSAPPVTLNEKIRLLRTGSVSHALHDEK